MQRIHIDVSTALSVGATTPVMVSIEGGRCRLYMGSVPEDAMAGHSVTAGYQVIVPAGLDVYATASQGASVSAVVGPFGV